MNRPSGTILSRMVSFLIVYLVLGGILNPTGAQPITFPSSMSIGEDDFMVRVQLWYERSPDDPSGRDREWIDRETRLFGMYGLTQKTALFSRISYVDRVYDDGSTRHVENGLGDLEFFVRRTVYEHNRSKGTFSMSPYVGMELPTGDDRSSNLPRSRTLGSGAVDGLAGLAVRDAVLGEPHRFFNVEYQWNREHNNFERGDVLKTNAAWKPPLTSWERDGGLVGINGMLEANFQWQDHDRDSGVDVQSSGGTQLLGTFGAVYTTHRTILEGAVQLPIVENLNGKTLGTDYRIVMGIWRNF